jgi:hypothetical protein
MSSVSYISNSIDGWMYQVDNTAQRNSINNLGKLLELIDLQETLGTTSDALTTLQDEGADYVLAYDGLSAALPGLTGGSQSAVLDVLNDVDFTNAYNDYNSSSWSGLEIDITNLRITPSPGVTNSDFENLVNTALEDLTESAFIIKRPSLQDIIVYDYGTAGNALVDRQLNGLTNTLENSHLAMQALNDLYAVAGLEPDSNEVNMDITLSIMQDTFYPLQSQMANSYDTLSNLIANSQIVASYQSVVTIVLNQAAALVNAIKVSGNPSGGNNLNNYFISYWNDMDTINDINTVVYDLTFLNTKTKQQIQETLMVYEQFTSSSTSLLAKLHRVVRSMAQQIE